MQSFPVDQLVGTPDGFGRVMYQRFNSVYVLVQTGERAWEIRNFHAFYVRPVDGFLWSIQNVFKSKG